LDLFLIKFVGEFIDLRKLPIGREEVLGLEFEKQCCGMGTRSRTRAFTGPPKTFRGVGYLGPKRGTIQIVHQSLGSPLGGAKISNPTVLKKDQSLGVSGAAEECWNLARQEKLRNFHELGTLSNFNENSYNLFHTFMFFISRFLTFS
jgi:hypothetical protein